MRPYQVRPEPSVLGITRRSQVQILPPPPKRPGQNLFLTRSFRVSATALQPVATQRRVLSRVDMLAPVGVFRIVDWLR